jgi:hypothetical protein
MSHEERQAIQTKAYTEAIRYMDNAKETLKKAGKEDYYYNDRKYVRMASEVLDARVIQAGFDEAYKIIEYIRPGTCSN